MLWPPIVKILAQHLSSEEYVKANLIVTSAAHIATVLLYLYAPLCLILFDWKSVFISAGVLAAIMFIVFIFGLSLVLPKHSTIQMSANEETSEKAPSIAPTTDNFAKLLLRSGIVPIFIAIITMGFLRDGIESWLPTLYSEAFNRDASESILISVILPIFSIISISLTTSLHKTVLKNETFGAATVFGIAVILCIPLYLLMGTTSATGRVICLVLAALICGCMHACNFLYISCLPRRFARHGHAAGASGICNACTYIGAAISNYGIALIAVHLGWKENILVWCGVALLGVICAIISYKKYTAFCNEENE